MDKKEFINEAYIIKRDIVDSLNYVTRSSTTEQRRKFDIGDVYINAAVCLKCKDYIRSKNRHDFVFCSCGSIAVDGGSWYCRRAGDMSNCVDVIEYFHDVKKSKKK